MIGDDRDWKVMDHVCRHCMGRVLLTDGVVMCSACGREESVTARAKLPASWSLCCCSLSEGVGRLRTGATIKQPFRCTPNIQKTETNSAEIMVMFGDLAAVPIPVATT